jgi:hypothetical protein
LFPKHAKQPYRAEAGHIGLGYWLEFTGYMAHNDIGSGQEMLHPIHIDTH